MIAEQMKVALIALGCEKNIINSEQMLSLLAKEGFRIVPDPADADITVINTCGFIEDAREEARERIFETAETGSKIVLAGCFAEYLREFGMSKQGSRERVHFALNPDAEKLPVDGFVGTGSFDEIVKAVRSVADGQTPLYFGDIDAPISETPRIHTGTPHTASIKIAEGCDNNCAYCIIPKLRGKYRARSPKAIISEANSLINSGRTELILIAQDTTKYPKLIELINELCEIPKLRKLRLHYLYPELLTDDLLKLIAKQPKIAKYLDIPIQHASDKILRAMNRRYDKGELEQLFLKIRKFIPNVTLRSSIIVGFPGETDKEFNELCRFLRWAKIPRIGVFCYSREAGTAAYDMLLQVSEKTKIRRKLQVEYNQSVVIDDFNRQREGQTLEVLTEGYDSYVKLYFGRSDGESPEVDGLIFFTSDKKLHPGEWVNVLVEGAIEGDGKGRIV